MPLTLTVGISKKMGLPNYGSLGALCHVEVELESGLLSSDLATFQHHVSDAYAACSQAVNDELARHRATFASPAAEPAAVTPPPVEDLSTGEAAAGVPTAGHTNGNGNANGAGNGAGNGNGASNGNSQRATGRQVDFARTLAGQIRGLGLRRLDPTCQALFGRPVAELSGSEASQLIDALKKLRAGAMDLEQLFQDTVS